MKRRTGLLIPCVLALLAISIMPMTVRPVKASESIVIRADGSIEGTNKIVSSNNITYTFTADINGSITIEKDNIVLDGAGYKLLATSGEQSGVSLAGRTNVTVEHTDIEAFYYGVLLQSSCLHNNIIENNMKGNKYDILVNSSPNNTIADNILTAAGDTGIKLVGSAWNTISGNNLTLNKIGISECSLRNNVMRDNDYNLDVYGLWGLSSYIQDIDSSNTVNGKSVQYLIDQHDLTINPLTFPEIGYLAIVNSTDIMIENLNLSKNVEGVLVATVANLTVAQNNFTDNDHGLLIYGCNGSRITGNTLSNRAYSVRLVGCLDSYVHDNNITGTIDAVSVEGCSNVTISRNSITNSGFWALWLSGAALSNVTENTVANGANGIRLQGAYSNRIFSNNLTGNGIGISFENRPYSSSSYNNSCYENNITGNQLGISFTQSSNNSIWRNNIVGNTRQVSTDTSSNNWDQRYSFGGNYWSNYTGTDANHDGIGDAPHIIDENNTDRYPLAAPYASDVNCVTFCAGTWDTVSYYVSIASNSTISDFLFDENQRQLSFNVVGLSSTLGFCRIEIPNALLDGEYTVYLDSVEITPLVTSDGANSFVYITYTHSNHNIRITGITAIPESLSLLAAPAATLISILLVLAQRKKAKSHPRNQLKLRFQNTENPI